VDTLSERDDDRFEEVLGRLDALVRRGQPNIEPPPPPIVLEASIPVLTEVYRPPAGEGVPEVITQPEGTTQQPGSTFEEKLDQIMATVLPVMMETLEDALWQKVQPALESAVKQALVDLRPQTQALLRQRLQHVLAQQKDQTDI
jgi:hypothetical protein